MTITVRAATETDLPRLLELYGELNPDDPPLSAQAADRLWTEIVAQRGRTVLVAEVAGALVGTTDCIMLPNLTRGGRAILGVENVVVARAERRRGVGRHLMEAVLRLAESGGCYKVQLLAAEDQEVHGFYRACGFMPLAQGFRRYL